MQGKARVGKGGYAGPFPGCFSPSAGGVHIAACVFLSKYFQPEPEKNAVCSALAVYVASHAEPGV